MLTMAAAAGRTAATGRRAARRGSGQSRIDRERAPPVARTTSILHAGKVGPEMPALLMRDIEAAELPLDLREQRITWASSATSARTARLAPNADASSSSAAASTSHTIQRAPASVSCAAMTPADPEAPAVTSARRPSSEPPMIGRPRAAMRRSRARAAARSAHRRVCAPSAGRPVARTRPQPGR